MIVRVDPQTGMPVISDEPVKVGRGGGGSFGVSSLSKQGSTPLKGEVTLSAGSNVTLTQTGNNIAIASSGGGGGGGQVDTVVAGTGISVDATDPVNPVVSSTITQYTDELAQDTVGGILVDTSEIALAYSDATPSISASLRNGSIDEARLDASVNASLDLADSSVQPARAISTSTGLSGGGNLSADRTLSLANTAVTPGSYTAADITVDAQGRLTSAANGSPGGGNVSKVGTPVNNQVGVWTGDGTIEGDVDLTFDTTTNTLATVNIAPSGTVDGRDVATDGTKLDGIETAADVTDTANVTAAGALMDSEVTNLAQVKAFASSDYATAAQGSTADSAVQPGDLATVATTGAYSDLSGTPTVPVKASGAEVDTGTDDAKFTTAKALKDSHNVPSVVPSTAGKLMRSDGTDWTSASVTTADVAASTNKNYVTDAQAVVIGNTSGTNTGNQTSIVGISGTKAQFDTAVSDGNILYVGDVTQYTDEMAQDAVGNAVGTGLSYDDGTGAISSTVTQYTDELAQDAVGAMVDTTIVYTDGTPLLSRAALTGDVTASAGSNTTAIGAGVIVNADINASAAIDATKIADGSVTSTEFQYISTLGSNAQTQIDGKQPLDSDLTTIAGLTATTDNFMVAASSAWASRTPAQAKTSLALVKGDVGLGNVDNTSDATKDAASTTLTNKTLTDPTINQFNTASGLGAAWATWSPTLVGLSGGTQTYAVYRQYGKSVDFRFKYTLAGAGVSGSATFTLPVTAAAYGVAAIIGAGTAWDNSATTPYPFYGYLNSTTVCAFVSINAGGAQGVYNFTSSTVPFTWATADFLYVAGTYEAA